MFLRVLGIWLGACLAGWLGASFSAAPAAASAPAHEFKAASSISRADDLIGRLVETRDGEELGRVRDFAIDLNSGRVAYVVVAVGSFLIEESLIAVDPRALRGSADTDGRLVLEVSVDSLRGARRFSGSDWPLRADIVAGASRAPEPAAAQELAGDGYAGSTDRSTGSNITSSERGSAVISDGTRTATLSSGERSIRTAEPADAGRSGGANGTTGSGAAGDSEPSPAASAAPAPAGGPREGFDRLDLDGTGALDRAQIAHELRPGDRYSAIDTNGDGLIQRSEYEAWMRSGKPRGQQSSQ
jgi:sporulation protein YlmC with PRC-barrel domain